MLDRPLDQVINRKYLIFSEGRALISIEWQSDKLGGVQIGAGSATCTKQKLHTAFCEIWNLQHPVEGAFKKYIEPYWIIKIILQK